IRARIFRGDDGNTALAQPPLIISTAAQYFVCQLIAGAARAVVADDANRAREPTNPQSLPCAHTCFLHRADRRQTTSAPLPQKRAATDANQSRLRLPFRPKAPIHHRELMPLALDSLRPVYSLPITDYSPYSN